MSGRLIAIGDVHGCALALDELLRRVAPTADDVLVTLGDYIDRGPDSRRVIERMIELERECRLVPLLGNHEEMLLVARDHPETLPHWLRYGGVTTLDSYGFGVGPRDLPEEHVAFLLRCVPYYETERHLLLHAGYLPDLPLAEQPPEVLRWTSLDQAAPPLPHQSDKRAIVGHTAQKNGEILDLGHVVCLDTYCYGGGWLTALELNTGAIWQVNNEGQWRDAT